MKTLLEDIRQTTLDPQLTTIERSNRLIHLRNEGEHLRAILGDTRAAHGTRIRAHRRLDALKSHRTRVTKDGGSNRTIGGFDEWWTVTFDGEPIGRVVRQVMADRWMAYDPKGNALHAPRERFATIDRAVVAVLEDALLPLEA